MNTTLIAIWLVNSIVLGFVLGTAFAMREHDKHYNN